MTCQQCGQTLTQIDRFCPRCGRATYSPAVPGGPLAGLQYASPAGGTPPPNYLAQAILCTLFCCMPFGVVAIVFAAQVNGKFAAGDVAGAANASRQAKMWATVAFLCGLVVVGLWIVTAVIGAATQSHR